MERKGLAKPLVTLSFVLYLAVSGAACFKPNIADGGFRCAASGTLCPDGFTCDLAAGLCRKLPFDGGAAGKGGIGGAAGADGAAGAGGAGGGPSLPCFEPKPSCEPSDAGRCDPYCQSGCAGCRDKCSVSTSGDLTCNPPTSTQLVGTLQACSISSAGLPAQSDDCEPGSVCIGDEVCFARCFRFCRTDQDCDNASCSRDVGGGQKACGIPYQDTCSPLMIPFNSGCGVVGMACYLSATHPEHTFCDCPVGYGTSGAVCTRSRDCNPGLACTYIPSVGKAQCMQVCELSKDGSECINGGVCRQYHGASGAEPAHARWGFCPG